IYPGYGNPTLSVAEKKIAALEGAEAAVVAAAGRAAIASSLLAVLKAGDELISTAQLYGGTYRLMRDVFPNLGITVHHVQPDLCGIEKLVNARTRALYVETPTNPTLRLVDIEKAVAFANKHHLVSLIDNTFATPVLQNPIRLGYDLVVHSATKALAGHSDILAGVSVGSQTWMDKVRQMIIYLGGSLDPGAAYLLIRGIKTLGVRVARQCENAMAVATFLEKHRKVERVHYPGLPSHPDHELAKRQMRGFSSMLTFDMKGGLQAARRVGDRVTIYVENLIRGGNWPFPLLRFWQQRLHNVFQFVGALNVLRVVVRGDVKRLGVLRADVLQLLLETKGNALGIQ